MTPVMTALLSDASLRKEESLEGTVAQMAAEFTPWGD